MNYRKDIYEEIIIKEIVCFKNGQLYKFQY